MSGRITRWQVALVTIMGTLGGVYIWKPALEEHAKKVKEESLKTEKISEG